MLLNLNTWNNPPTKSNIVNRKKNVFYRALQRELWSVKIYETSNFNSDKRLKNVMAT